MATRTKDLPLNELYEKKITISVETAIHNKEDFTNIAPTYCDKVCKLKCKSYNKVNLIQGGNVDILIIQDHAAPKGKWDKRDDGQEVIQRGVINFICKEAGFTGLNVRITNLLKCAPNERDFPKGKAPTITVLSKCKPYLLAEIKACNPKVIISLSTAVTKALGYKKHSNTNNRGEILDNRVVITLHPRVLSMIRQNSSGAMWGNDYFNIIKRDFEKAAALARGNLTLIPLREGVERQRRNIHVCRTLEEMEYYTQLIQDFPEGTMISCDTETTGLDGMHPSAKLLCIQFGWRDPDTDVYKAVVIPLKHRANTWYDPEKAWELVTPILENSEIPKVGHNFKFDYLYIYHTTGVKVRGFSFDTMLLLHALDSGIQGCLSLKTAMWDHCLDLNIAGYEDLLPKLTKKKVVKEKTGDESDEDLESEDDETDGDNDE